VDADLPEAKTGFRGDDFVRFFFMTVVSFF